MENELRQAITRDMVEFEKMPHAENAAIRAKIRATDSTIQLLPDNVFMEKQAADYICRKLNAIMQMYVDANHEMVEMVQEMGQMQEALDGIKAAASRFSSSP